MLAPWIEVLPLFIVRRLARWLCPVIVHGGVPLHEARPDVYFRAQRKEGPTP